MSCEGEIGHLTLRLKLPSMFLSDYPGKEEIMAAAVRNLWFHTGDRIRVHGENISSF